MPESNSEYSDWPPGYVPGQGFVNQPDVNGAPDTNDQFQGQSGQPLQTETGSAPVVPLSQLQMKPQSIDCPNCHERHQTKVAGRSEGKKKLHNILWWPMPNRKHYWEKTHWYCSNCDYELAMQKFGKPLQVLAKQG